VADVLYHYTCAHSAKSISGEMALHPNAHPLLGDLELVWLTDLDVPDVYALGLTSRIIKCRRTEFRVTAGETVAIHWPEFARQLRRTTADRQVLAGVAALESAPGALPMHWWVALSPVPVVELEAVSR
jgi:hypothetical protein